MFDVLETPQSIVFFFFLIVLSFVHEDHELDFYPFVGRERVPEDTV